MTTEELDRWCANNFASLPPWPDTNITKRAMLRRVLMHKHPFTAVTEDKSLMSDPAIREWVNKVENLAGKHHAKA